MKIGISKVYCGHMSSITSKKIPCVDCDYLDLVLGPKTYFFGGNGELCCIKWMFSNDSD